MTYRNRALLDLCHEIHRVPAPDPRGLRGDTPRRAVSPPTARSRCCGGGMGFKSADLPCAACRPCHAALDQGRHLTRAERHEYWCPRRHPDHDPDARNAGGSRSSTRPRRPPSNTTGSSARSCYEPPHRTPVGPSHPQGPTFPPVPFRPGASSLRPAVQYRWQIGPAASALLAALRPSTPRRALNLPLGD